MLLFKMECKTSLSSVTHRKNSTIYEYKGCSESNKKRKCVVRIISLVSKFPHSSSFFSFHSCMLDSEELLIDPRDKKRMITMIEKIRSSIDRQAGNQLTLESINICLTNIHMTFNWWKIYRCSWHWQMRIFIRFYKQ